MTDVINELTAIATAMSSTPRPAQLAAAAEIAKGALHTALRAPTGSGKSAIAAAAAAASPEGAVISMFSNGLVGQYINDIPVWEKATGKSFAPLVGSAHYWCPVAAPDLSFLAPAVQAHIERTGTFVGSGLMQSEYVGYSVKAVSAPVSENADADEDETTAKSSPCKACHVRGQGACPLWNARDAAAAAHVVVTNVTVAALAISASGGPQESWLSMIDRPLHIVDEAHAAAEPIQSILGKSVTISKRTATVEQATLAAESATETMALVRSIAYADRAPNDSQKVIDLRVSALDFLKALGDRAPLFDADARKPKATVTVPVSLREFFADRQVIAMSGTLSAHYTAQLGLNAPTIELQGLDVSASTVHEMTTFTKWSYPNAKNAEAVAAHKRWATDVAAGVSGALNQGGRTLLILQSNSDLDAVLAALPAAERARVLIYKSGVDRARAIETYKANPDRYVLAGFAAGAGTGVNLPHDLIRTVILGRVPQSPPMGSDRVKFMEDSKSAVVQSVGRGHRADDDWANVFVLGGFGSRNDIRQALLSDGWKIESR